jgi:hypothetical protein
MRTFIGLLALFLTTNLRAEVFTIAGEAMSFELKEGLLLWGCEKNCDALKIIKKHKVIDLVKLRKGMSFVNSVGSDICQLAYKGSAVLGTNAHMDGRAFCVFSDQSMIEMNSLTAYLSQKKILKQSR